MKIIEPSFKIIREPYEPYGSIERIGRVCYKSEDKITEDSCVDFVKMIVKRGHYPMLDHVHASVLFIIDRGVSHELVRHRMAAFAQESTRYCNYKSGKFDGECTFIRPSFWAYNEGTGVVYKQPFYYIWVKQMEDAEAAYLNLIKQGASPQEARSVLPNSLKTEIVVTADFTEWRHIFKLRTTKFAHPQMREVMIPCLLEFNKRWPEVFNDIIDGVTV